MKNWQETDTVYTRAAALLAEGQSVALAVIVQIQGSTYRRAGAKLLIESDGRMTGNVSGGCLEEDVREHGLAVICSGEPRLVHYDASDAEDKIWGMGLGCNGQVDLFIRALTDSAHLREVIVLLQGDKPFAMLTDLKTGITTIQDVDSTSPDNQFLDVLRPPPTLLICGAGEDALPLATLAHEVGFRIEVADHRRAYATPDRFPMAREMRMLRPAELSETPAWLTDHTLAVVKTHALQHDLAWVERLVLSDVPYIGLLGPRDRRNEILNRVDPRHHPRIYGPVGLDLGGEGPEQVALSIVAEALAVWHKRNGGMLRARTSAIHTN